MSRVLVLGDGIIDHYQHYTATRLCPEGPVPILVQAQKPYSSTGGAGLVADQLHALMPANSVYFWPGTQSFKTRIFSDDRLMLRIDEDAIRRESKDDYKKEITSLIKVSKPDAIIVSDYDKGSFTYDLGSWLVRHANSHKIKVFVDAKNTWNYYMGAFAMFPNKIEGAQHACTAKHIIQKLGPGGCRVDGIEVPTKTHAVRDVTGAGDVFLAAFVHSWLLSKDLIVAANFANRVAGISVEYVGTHVVTKQEIENG